MGVIMMGMLLLGGEAKVSSKELCGWDFSKINSSALRVLPVTNLFRLTSPLPETGQKHPGQVRPTFVHAAIPSVIPLTFHRSWPCSNTPWWCNKLCWVSVTWGGEEGRTPSPWMAEEAHQLTPGRHACVALLVLRTSQNPGTEALQTHSPPDLPMAGWSTHWWLRAVIFGKYHGVDLICSLHWGGCSSFLELSIPQTHWYMEGRPSSLGLVTDLGVGIAVTPSKNSWWDFFHVLRPHLFLPSFCFLKLLLLSVIWLWGFVLFFCIWDKLPVGHASLGKTGGRSPHLPENPAPTTATFSLLQTFPRAIGKFLEQSELQRGSKDAWHLPKGEKIRSESAVWKTPTLSSKISLTAGHRSRHNEGKQPGWGGVSSCPQPWPLGMAFPKGASPGWPHLDVLRHPQCTGTRAISQSYPQIPAHWTHSLLQCHCTAHSEEAVHDFRCPGREKSFQQWGFACGNGCLLGIPYPARGEKEWTASQVPCTLLGCQLYFWLLQAGVSQEKKKKVSLKL